MCACPQLPRNPTQSVPLLLRAYPLHFAAPISLNFSRASTWIVLCRTLGCGRGSGRVWVKESAYLFPLLYATLRKAATHIHIYAGPQCPPGWNCFGSGCHGDGPAAWTTAPCEMLARACKPGRLRALRVAAFLSFPLVPSTVPGIQGLLGINCLSGDPQAVLGQTGLAQIPFLPLRGHQP